MLSTVVLASIMAGAVISLLYMPSGSAIGRWGRRPGLAGPRSTQRYISEMLDTILQQVG